MRELSTMPVRSPGANHTGHRLGPQRPARYGGARGGSPATLASYQPGSLVLKALGRVRGVRRMNAVAKEAVARTYAEILRRRHPGTEWIVRPVERAHGLGGDAGAGQVIRRLSMPEDADALVHGRLDPRAAHEDAVDPGAQ